LAFVCVLLGFARALREAVVVVDVDLVGGITNCKVGIIDLIVFDLMAIE